MLAILPESSSRVRRPLPGVAWSVLAHGALAALLTLAGTGEISSTPAPPTRDTTLLYLPPVPQPERTGGTDGSPSPSPAPHAPRTPVVRAPTTVPIGLPPVDPAAAPVLTSPLPPTGAWAERPTVAGSSPAGGGSGDPTGIYTRAAERGAVALPENPRPRYPETLRSARIEGSVLAEFVVDTSGHVELTTVRIIDSDHALFTDAVRAALPRLRFAPAEADGRRVRQWVRLPFEFRLER